MSVKYKLSRTDKDKWVRNLKRFVAPVGIMYLMQVVATLSVDGHLFAPQDFYPSKITQGGMILYFLNSIMDIFNKWKDET